MKREDFDGPEQSYIVARWDTVSARWVFRPVIGGPLLTDEEIAALGLMVPVEIDPIPALGRPIPMSQTNPIWKGDKLGTTSQTIGGWGCAMVNACMVYSQIDPMITPRGFNSILTINAGYNYLNGEAHLAWDRLPNIFSGLKWKGRADYSRRLTSAELQAIYQKIDVAPLVLWVDFKPTTPGLDTHFVLAIGHANDDITIIDPYGGDEVQLLKRYAVSGQDLQRAIWGYRELVAELG